MGKGKNSNWLELPASCSDLAGACDLVFLDVHWARPACLLQVSKGVGVSGQCLIQNMLGTGGEVTIPGPVISFYMNVTQMECVCVCVCAACCSYAHYEEKRRD